MWDLLGHSSCSRACRWDGFWKNGQTLAKGKNSYHSLLSWTSLSSVWLREKCKNFMLFLPLQIQLGRRKTGVRISSLNYGWWISFQVPTDYQSFPSQGQLLLSCSSCFEFSELGLNFCLLGYARFWFLCVEVAQLSGWGPQNMAGQKCGLHLICGYHPTNCCQLLVCVSFFLLATFGSDSGPWEVCIKFHTLFGHFSCVSIKP